MAGHLEDISIGPLASPALREGFRWEQSPRRVRVELGGETVADSRRVMLLHEAGRLPVFYFPMDDVRMDRLERTDHSSTSPLKGAAAWYTVRAGGKTEENAAWSYDDPPAGAPDMKGYIAFYWMHMDAWYEEDERAFAHARDPYKLVDTRHSTRHVRVELNGVTVAETRRPLVLFETGLPVRYYIPREDVRTELLEPTATTSECAYKGAASYWSARVDGKEYADIAWTYTEPLALVAPIAGLVCFFNERVDALEVDGEREQKPKTQWS